MFVDSLSKGPCKDQLETALWFTFSTVFFSHREVLKSNYTRVVIVIWLFTVLVVTASYTASLTSMLTVQRIEPTVVDIQTLNRTDSVVGCAGASFVRKYLVEVLHFNPNNTRNFETEKDCREALSNKTIKATLLELPYKKVFLSKYCKDYKDTGLNHRLGGLAFAFPKGSPITPDFSEAILKLSENGNIIKLEKERFETASECSNSGNSVETGSLSLENFSALDESMWNQFRRVFSLPVTNQVRSPPETPLPLNNATTEGISVKQEHLSPYNSSGHIEASPAAEIEMQDQVSGSSSTKGFLNLTSFPQRGRRDNGFQMDRSGWNCFFSSGVKGLLKLASFPRRGRRDHVFEVNRPCFYSSRDFSQLSK